MRVGPEHADRADRLAVDRVGRHDHRARRRAARTPCSVPMATVQAPVEHVAQQRDHDVLLLEGRRAPRGRSRRRRTRAPSARRRRRRRASSSSLDGARRAPTAARHEAVDDVVAACGGSVGSGRDGRARDVGGEVGRWRRRRAPRRRRRRARAGGFSTAPLDSTTTTSATPASTGRRPGPSGRWPPRATGRRPRRRSR